MNQDQKNRLAEAKTLLAGHKHTIASYPFRRENILEEIAKLQNQLAFLDTAREKAPASIQRLEREVSRLDGLKSASAPSGGALKKTPQEKLEARAEKLRELAKGLPPELVQQMLDGLEIE
jgi:chromosome segregation ATPase